MWWSTSTLWQLSCPEPAAPSASASETTTTRWEDGTVCLESGIIHCRPGYKTYSFLGWVQNPPHQLCLLKSSTSKQIFILNPSLFHSVCLFFLPLSYFLFETVFHWPQQTCSHRSFLFTLFQTDWSIQVTPQSVMLFLTLFFTHAVIHLITCLNIIF